MKKFFVDKIFKTIPDEKTFYTRDNKIPAQSKDYIYLCIILKNWHSEIKSLSIYQTKKAKHIMLLTDKSGLNFNPVTGEPFDMQGLVFKNKLLKGKVKTYVRKRFYGYRNAIISKHYKSETIIIDNLKILDNGILLENSYNILNNRLRWPMNSDSDISNSFIDYLKINDNYSEEIVGKYDAYCPVDGFVHIVYGKHISPDWTWSALCGREFQVLLCPRCLGVFGSYLTKIS